MNGTPFLIDCFLNSIFFVQSLIDTGCLCYAAFSHTLVKEKNLPRIPVIKRSLQLAENDGKERIINEIIYANFDIDGRREKIFGYIFKDLAYDIIFGKPWIECNNVVYLSKKRAIRFGSNPNSLIVREKWWFEDKAPSDVRSQIGHVATTIKVMAANFLRLFNSVEGENGCQVFAITVEDLNKALAIQTHDSPEEIREKLPQEIESWFRLFVEDKDSTLPPHRKSDMK
ncbi:hypothetical protein K3495_g4780 [Podosphaera aphanis]|nr:hypothetical protein K3495_g4780 [Podosphaera aphanis]